jgi:hypothetical protein
VTDAEESDLGRLLRTRIEEPAARRLLELHRQGAIQDTDVRRFRVSAERYREAILNEYHAFDPQVRCALHQSLLTDYQRTVTRLIAEMVGRLEGRPDPVRAGRRRRTWWPGWARERFARERAGEGGRIDHS